MELPPPDAPCPNCGGQMFLNNGRFGKFLSCQHYPDCDMIRAVYVREWDSKTEYGVFSDRPTRQARRQLHEFMDPLWREEKLVKRKELYKWLCEGLGLEKNDCHIRYFDIDTCKKATAIIEAKIKELGARAPGSKP